MDFKGIFSRICEYQERYSTDLHYLQGQHFHTALVWTEKNRKRVDFKHYLTIRRVVSACRESTKDITTLASQRLKEKVT